MKTNMQNGWGWFDGREGYCGDCAGPNGENCSEPTLFRTFLDSGLAVDYCCNCGRDNPNANETGTERRTNYSLRRAVDKLVEESETIGANTRATIVRGLRSEGKDVDPVEVMADVTEVSR